MKAYIISALFLAFMPVQANVVVDGEALPMNEGEPAPAILLKELDSLGVPVSGLPQEEPPVAATDAAAPAVEVPQVSVAPSAVPATQEAQPEMMQVQIISYAVSFLAVLAVIGILYYARRVKREELPPPQDKE